MITKMFLCNWTPSEARITLDSIVGINTLIFPLPFEASKKIRTVICFKQKKKKEKSDIMTYTEALKHVK